MQETYARVLSRPRLLRSDDDIGYLLQIMRNLFLDQRRAAARRPVETIDPDDLERMERSVAAGPQAAVETREVFAAVSALPDDFRDVIVAVDIVGLSYKEAAKSLKIAEGTVMSRLYRARGRVAKELGAA